MLHSKHGHVTPCLMKASGHPCFTRPERPHHFSSLTRTTPCPQPKWSPSSASSNLTQSHQTSALHMLFLLLGSLPSPFSSYSASRPQPKYHFLTEGFLVFFLRIFQSLNPNIGYILLIEFSSPSITCTQRRNSDNDLKVCFIL